MGSPAMSPVMMALLPALMAKLQAGGGGLGAPTDMSGGPGGPGGPPGMMGGGPGADTGPTSTPADMAASASFGRELSSARQANPAALAAKIHDIKMQVGEILSATLASNPRVASSLGKMLPHLDMAIKEATNAAAALQVAQPIQASAASGAPGAGGSNPAPISVPGIGGQY